jgi:hypothetical protein
VFAGIVQYNAVEDGQTKIEAVCSVMTAAHLGSPLQRLALLVSKSSEDCVATNYEKFVKKYRKSTWDPADISLVD